MSIASPQSFLLLTEKLPTVFTGVVNGTPANPYMTINISSGVTGSFGAPLPGMTVSFGTRGVQRLRSWTPTQISIGESDDLGPLITNGDAVNIYAQWRLWPIYPRLLQAGTNVTFYEDYDIAWNQQTNQWRPVAVAGPPAVVEYNGVNASALFVGDRSFALAPGAMITGYLWTAPGSTQVTSTSQGTEGSPVTFTWTSTGQKLVYLTVTDSNGNTAVNYTWVFVVDPNNPTTVAYTSFDTLSDSFDSGQGGGQASFVVHGSATISDFPNECLIIVANRGTLTTPTSSWPNRSNVQFVGYVIGNTVRQNPTSGDVSFRAVSIDGLMRNITMFPMTLTDKIGPQDWTMAKSLTVDRAASFLWRFRSTLSLMASIVPSNYTPLIRRQDFGPGDMLSQLNGELLSSIWGRVVVNHQGVVHHLIDYNLMNSTERAAITIRKTLSKGIWIDDVNIEERMTYSLPVNAVKMSGLYYPGGELEDICPLFSEAPGNAPKVYGREMNYDRLILASQTDLNERCGLALAKNNLKYPTISMRFINDGSFTIAPQEIFPPVIEASDNDRGLAFTTSLVPRRINRTYDNKNGAIFYDVSFEPRADGAAGVTVDLPCGPPEQKLGGNTTIPTTSDSSLATALASSSLGSSFYFANGVGQTWQRRVNGLTAPAQLIFEDMIQDPWSNFKNGHNINQIIFWGCGAGFLSRSPDSGQQWEDHTSYLDTPPNSWGDATAPNITGTTVKQVMGDIFREDNLYLLLQGAGTGSAYRGWIQRSTDAGFTFTSYALTGTAQTYPIRMDIDKQDGTLLWVTTWESGTIFLRKHAISNMALTTKYPMMTGTAVADVVANTYTANPYTPLGNKNQIYAYGRMNNPQGLTGTVAVLQSANAGSNWSVLANDWGTDYCGSLFASEGSQLYAVRNSSDTPLAVTVSSVDVAIEMVCQQLSSTRAMIAYTKSAGAAIKFAWIDITSNPPVVLSTAELAPASTTIDHISLAMASSTQCVAVWRNKNGANYSGVSMIVSVVADVISTNVAGEGTYLGNSATARPTFNSVAVVSSTKAIVAYRISSTQSQACVLDLNLGTNVITPNTPADINTNSASEMDICKIDSTSALVVYSESAAGAVNLVCNVLDAIGTGFTLGAKATIDADDPFDTGSQQHYLVNSGLGAFLAWQSHAGSNFVIKTVSVSVSGSTATPGTPAQYTSGGDYYGRATSANSSIFVYDDQTNGTTLRSGAVILSVAIDIKSVDGSNGVLGYVDSSDSSKPKVMVLN